VVRVRNLRRQISFFSANSTYCQGLATIQRSPELLILPLYLRQQSCQASLPQNLPLNRLKKPPAIEHSQFQPAEYPRAEYQTILATLLRLLWPEVQAR
jgi:hypothetical protein